AQSLTGWGPDAIGRPLDEVFVILNEETHALLESPVTRVLREGKIVELPDPTILVARDGRHRPIDDSAAPIEKDGRLIGVVLVFRDVSNRRQDERALRESERRLRRLSEFQQAVMENIGEGLFTVDLEGRVTYMNPAAEVSFGWKNAELLGHNMHD